MRFAFLCSVFLFIFLAPLTMTAQQIPSGTVLPIMLNSTLNTSKDQPGKKISGKVMQDVLLSGGGLIPRRATIAGHVLRVSKAGGNGSYLAVTFDRVMVKGQTIPITANLRAVASMMAVFEAKIPTNALDDYGTSQSDWNTVQVGGAGVFRGNGEVIGYGEVVGRANDYGAVTAKLIAAPKAGCRAEDESAGEQALWVFSPWACGTYGFLDLKIAHAGRSEPVGEIELRSERNIYIQGGSGWLLRTEGSSQPASAK